MIYAVKPSGGYTNKDFPRFPALLHRRLDGPVTVIWDNYFSHISKHVNQYAQRQDWLTVIQLPSYAPGLNPVELLWAHAIANRAFRSINELHRAVKSALRYIQRRPELLIGFLAGTGLELTPPASSPESKISTGVLQGGVVCVSGSGAVLRWPGGFGAIGIGWR
ncbi:transposase [Streptomyces sp. NPDC127051]|uniref:transposase n=1 Tax=Streptomyces sp. NPDC127051 TaxID=3347119 RepID=UPI003665D72D